MVSRPVSTRFFHGYPTCSHVAEYTDPLDQAVQMPPATLRGMSHNEIYLSFATLAGLYGAYRYLGFPDLLQWTSRTSRVGSRSYSSTSRPCIEDFRKLVRQTTSPKQYPNAIDIKHNVPIYDCQAFDMTNERILDTLQDEIYHILTAGPGVFVMKHFFMNLDAIDSANSAYDSIIDQELGGNTARGDHFAPASANSRIWNSFSKHAMQDPTSFFDYFCNPWFNIVCESYLGPAYRLTSQVNVVRPGGKAQMPHRDYHLGFQTDEDVVKWPKAVHDMSSFLTLQGAVAHTDMPLESGPTRLLPYSHLFREGFRSYRSKSFVEYFEDNYVALPLEKGDAMFFNPALFHAAGENVTESFSRSANLIQVSSAFGKPMETIDTIPLIEQTYDLLLAKHEKKGRSIEVDAFVCAVAEGYPFPTNLDCRPPAPGGQAPESEQAILQRGLADHWSRERMVLELRNMRTASSASGNV